MFRIDQDCGHDLKIFLFLVSLFSCHPMIQQYLIVQSGLTGLPDALLLRSLKIFELQNSFHKETWSRMDRSGPPRSPGKVKMNGWQRLLISE